MQAKKPNMLKQQNINEEFLGDGGSSSSLIQEKCVGKCEYNLPKLKCTEKKRKKKKKETNRNPRTLRQLQKVQHIHEGE